MAFDRDPKTGEVLLWTMIWNKPIELWSVSVDGYRGEVLVPGAWGNWRKGGEINGGIGTSGNCKTISVPPEDWPPKVCTAMALRALGVEQ